MTKMKVTFPAGKYYIGDPCYVIDDDKWSQVCDQIFKDGSESRFNKYFDWFLKLLWVLVAAYVLFRLGIEFP